MPGNPAPPAILQTEDHLAGRARVHHRADPQRAELDVAELLGVPILRVESGRLTVVALDTAGSGVGTGAGGGAALRDGTHGQLPTAPSLQLAQNLAVSGSNPPLISRLGLTGNNLLWLHD